VIIPEDDEDEIWAVYIAAQMGGLKVGPWKGIWVDTFIVGDKDVTEIIKILELRDWLSVFINNDNTIHVTIRKGAP
jgi:hypothetical protein